MLKHSFKRNSDAFRWLKSNFCHSGPKPLGNLGWQNWEQFGKVEVLVGSPDPTSLIVNLDYQDTWHAAIGMQITIASLWRLSLGTAYDTDMIDNGKRSVSLPIGSAWRIGAGFEYFAREDFTVGVGYTRLNGGNLSVNQRRGPLTGRVAGDYQDTSVNYFGVNLDWMF